MAKLITSQTYLNTDIVEAKRAAADYAVLVSPVIAIDGVEYQVVLDGHHALAAALADGVEPEITIATASQHDAVGLIESGNIDDFLAVTHGGDDYIYAISRERVW